MNNKYKIVIKLNTETIFGSGHSAPGSVDLDVISDEYGFPYMKAKTFKGNLREEMEKTVDALERFGNNYKDIVDKLLGKENSGENLWENLKFSDCTINLGIKKLFEKAIDNGEISPIEMKESLTDVRKFTSIDEDGSASSGSLRQIRVIKKGLEFEVDMHCERELSGEELGILAISLRNLRHIGSMRTRGKGEVDCTLNLLEKKVYEDKTDYYIDNFLKEVK